VQTKFPDEKTRTADFGSFTLKTSPGNVSGLYSVFGWVLASFVKGTGFPKEAVATMFCILYAEVLVIFLIYKGGFSFIKVVKKGFRNDYIQTRKNLKRFLKIFFNE